ncbi:tRNA pseudouridine(55) synthase TruB [Leptospira perolatii]|uniref:tRNA pseudouridine synthase B n=1 Tax=Leptospira perolatii TaxID=2023191 RepID=A0A2M9ZL85_9LEPT|nr:tRNA pseudouridine(55) synthase TruB [Leptospira perolatii]PJZ70372.1 tRNA pseudouridine(55) synthase TruB [Leptospira perolatii]PJZ72744.1 tRNA pseudouridine(55) synthase TruB [Leptospira perolatii]
MNPSDLQESLQAKIKSGFLLLDKPVGMTSSDLVLKAKKTLNLHKVGHTGTLDKAACGLIILPIGSSTSFSQIFLTKEKEYLAEVQFGFSTDSGDREGIVLEDWEDQRIRNWYQEKKAQLDNILATVTDWEDQVAPEISALKVSGKRRAQLFREGVSVPQSVRKIKIYEFEVLELDYKGCKIRTKVSAGTYIRKLVMDIGEKAGIPMSLQSLTRTKIGKLGLDKADTYDALLSGTAIVHPPEEIVDVPSVEVPGTLVKDIFHGKKPRLEWIPAQEFLLISPEGQILAWCRRDGLPGSFNYKYLKVFPKN